MFILLNLFKLKLIANLLEKEKRNILMSVVLTITNFNYILCYTSAFGVWKRFNILFHYCYMDSKLKLDPKFKDFQIFLPFSKIISALSTLHYIGHTPIQLRLMLHFMLYVCSVNVSIQSDDIVGFYCYFTTNNPKKYAYTISHSLSAESGMPSIILYI